MANKTNTETNKGTEANANNSRGYSAKIIKTMVELNGKEKIALKDTSDSIRLDEVTNENSVLIDVANIVTLLVHNEKSDDKEYVQYVIVDKNGTKYLTGSTNLMDTMIDMIADMEGETEPYQIKVFKLPSKNYKGKYFLTCTIV